MPIFLTQLASSLAHLQLLKFCSINVNFMFVCRRHHHYACRVSRPPRLQEKQGPIHSIVLRLILDKDQLKTKVKMS